MKEVRELQVDEQDQTTSTSQATSESPSSTFRLKKQLMLAKKRCHESLVSLHFRLKSLMFHCFKSALQTLLQAKEIEYAKAQDEINGESVLFSSIKLL